MIGCWCRYIYDKYIYMLDVTFINVFIYLYFDKLINKLIEPSIGTIVSWKLCTNNNKHSLHRWGIYVMISSQCSTQNNRINSGEAWSMENEHPPMGGWWKVEWLSGPERENGFPVRFSSLGVRFDSPVMD